MTPFGGISLVGESKHSNVVEKATYWDQMVDKYGSGVKNRQVYMDLYKKPLSPLADKDFILSFDPPAGIEKTDAPITWENLITQRTDIDNPALLFASIMDEGGDRFTDQNDASFTSPTVSGFENFGLDRIGERVDEFIDRGFLEPGIKDRTSPRSHVNKKKEKITSLDFSNYNDIISAKRAYMMSAFENTDKIATDQGVELSPNARDYWSLVGFNYGETGARKMFKSYQDKGYFDDEQYLGEDFIPGSYKQIHTNATRRIQSARMLEGEGILPGRKRAKSAEPMDIQTPLEFSKPVIPASISTGIVPKARNGLLIDPYYAYAHIPKAQNGIRVDRKRAKSASAFDIAKGLIDPLIKGYESPGGKFNEKAYYATDKEQEQGILTVGYGTTNLFKPEITKGMKINEAQAQAWFDEKLESIYTEMEGINSQGLGDLNPNQQSAVMSLLYNIDPQSKVWQDSLAKGHLLAGEYDDFLREAYDPIRGFVKEEGGMDPMPGLVSRRQSERNLWSTPYQADVEGTVYDQYAKVEPPPEEKPKIDPYTQAATDRLPKLPYGITYRDPAGEGTRATSVINPYPGYDAFWTDDPQKRRQFQLDRLAKKNVPGRTLGLRADPGIKPIYGDYEEYENLAIDEKEQPTGIPSGASEPVRDNLALGQGPYGPYDMAPEEEITNLTEQPEEVGPATQMMAGIRPFMNRAKAMNDYMAAQQKQTGISPEMFDAFQKYKRDLSFGVGLRALSDFGQFAEGMAGLRENENYMPPKQIEEIQPDYTSPKYETIKPKIAEINKGFISAVRIARELGKPELITALLASRNDAVDKLTRQVGERNLQETGRVSELNYRSSSEANRVNAGIQAQNIAKRFEYDQLIAGAKATNRNLMNKSLSGIASIFAEQSTNRLTADVVKEMLANAGDLQTQQMILQFLNAT